MADEYRLRWFSEDVSPNHKSVALIEQKPRMQLVHYVTPSSNHALTKEFYIPLPWVYFIFTQWNHTHKFYTIPQMLGVSPKRITSIEDHLHYALLPNLRHGFGPCFTFKYQERNTSTYEDVIADKVASWWGAFFNEDYYQYTLAKTPSTIDALKKLVPPESISGSIYKAERTLARLQTLDIPQVKALPYVPFQKPIKDMPGFLAIYNAKRLRYLEIDELFDRQIPRHRLGEQ